MHILFPKSLGNRVEVRYFDFYTIKMNSVLLEFRDILLELNQQIRIPRKAIEHGF